jgi:DNA-binding HxlR family transcriptional regulator
MMTKDELPECPVATVVELIGNKWKLLIIRNLLANTLRFNELLKGIPGISQKVLTDNLRSLEANGLVDRTVYPEVPPRVEYSLTDIGQSLNPLFESIASWGDLYKSFIAEKEQ